MFFFSSPVSRTSGFSEATSRHVNRCPSVPAFTSTSSASLLVPERERENPARPSLSGRSEPRPPARLGLLVPQTQLLLGDVVREVEALAAALDAALVGGAFARRVPAAAVLELTRVPLQTQAVRAQTRLPRVFGGVARLRRLGQRLEHGGVHSCKHGREGGGGDRHMTVIGIVLFSIL